MDVATLTPLYDRWLQELLPGPVPAETEATCDDCAMQAPGQPLSFHPRTKCCTFLPELPNFLVGGALGDPDPALAAGRASLERRIDEGVAVTPLGVGSRPDYRLLFERTPDAFGRSLALRCPHYLEEAGGLCGIWRHRNSTCSTWFCKHRRGDVGSRFWHSLTRLLAEVERELASWCLGRLDVEPEVIERLFPRGGANPIALDAGALDRQPTAETRAAFWGRWIGRERELYLESARLVAPLRWDEVLAIAGPRLALLAGAVRANHARLLDTSLPARLVPATVQVRPLDADRAQVTAYSPYDPVELPRQLLDVLGWFDGRAVDEALAAMEAEADVALDPDLLRMLLDFGVLKEG